MAGWAHFGDPPILRPHLCLITNMLDANGNQLTTPMPTFDCRVKALPDDSEILWRLIGQPIKRQNQLERNLRRLVQREIASKEVLRLLMEEIIFTSKTNSAVGDKILGVCIPRKSVEAQDQSGSSWLLAKQPDEENATFWYYDRSTKDLLQYGPTFVCGSSAITDIETEDDPSRDYQSSQFRILNS